MFVKIKNETLQLGYSFLLFHEGQQDHAKKSYSVRLKFFAKNSYYEKVVCCILTGITVEKCRMYYIFILKKKKER